MDNRIQNIKEKKKIKQPIIPIGYIMIVAILVLIIFVVWFVSLFTFPAKKYVKSSLNAICYDNTKEYKKITNCSDEELKESVEADLRLQAEAYASYFGITDISDKSMEMLIDFSKEVYTYSKYKVTGQKKDGDDFVVTVKVKPILFDEISKDEIKEYINKFNARAEDSEFLYDTDAIYQEKFLEGLIKVYKKQLESIEYGEYEKIKVEVNKVSSKRYEADLTEVLNNLVLFE